MRHFRDTAMAIGYRLPVQVQEGGFLYNYNEEVIVVSPSRFNTTLFKTQQCSISIIEQVLLDKKKQKSCPNEKCRTSPLALPRNEK
jgi:hypothetical protein